MKKNTLISLSVFVVLAVAAFIVLLQKNERGIRRMSLEQIDAKTVDRVVLAGKNNVELVKDGDTWKLANGKIADGAAVQRLLDAIPKLKSSDWVSDEKGRFADFEVDEEKGTQVKIFKSGKILGEFSVGKMSAAGLHVKVKDGVYRVAGLSSGVFSRPQAQWLEHQLFKDKIEELSRLDVRLHGAPPYALVKKNNEWQLEDGKILPPNFRFDKQGAQNLVTGVLNVRAKDVLDGDPGADKTGLGGAKEDLFVLKVGEGDAARTRILHVGPEQEVDKISYARVEGRSDVVTLMEHTAKNLRKSPLDLRDLAFVSFEKDKVTKLNIQDGALALQLEKKDGSWRVAHASEKVPADFEFDPATVERRLGAMATAHGTKWVDPASGGAGFGAPTGKLTATLSDGKSASILFGKEFKEENRDMVYVQGSLDKNVYAATKWLRSSLLGGLSSFKKQAAPAGISGLDPKALSNLPPEVRESLMRQIAQKQREEQMQRGLQTK